MDSLGVPTELGDVDVPEVWREAGALRCAPQSFDGLAVHHDLGVCEESTDGFYEGLIVSCSCHDLEQFVLLDMIEGVGGVYEEAVLSDPLVHRHSPSSILFLFLFRLLYE